MKRSITTIFFCIAMLTGCATQTIYINGKGGKLTKDEMQTFFVSGIGQTQTIDAAATCGSADKVVKVEREYGFVNYLLGLVTLGIYTPYDARIYCKQKNLKTFADTKNLHQLQVFLP